MFTQTQVKRVVTRCTLASGALIAAAFTLSSCSKEQQVTYDYATVTHADISTSVTATGTIEPVTEVEVGTQVSGIIDHIYVDYNSIVKKGQLIAELDRTNLISELTSAKSNLAYAQSSLDYQKANYDRYASLFEKGLVSANDYENARLGFEQARQQVVVQQQNVTKAQTNLGYATITSPIDGVVLSREVEEGQTVASQMTTPTLFKIAADLTDMRVIADVDEADIGGVAEDQRVTFTVDAYPDDTFSGKVTQVRQEATTESNVVTYEVVISAPNDDLKLKPGLTANVTIFTAERIGVLAIPSKALRFTPNQTLLKDGQTIEGPKPHGASAEGGMDKNMPAPPDMNGEQPVGAEKRSKPTIVWQFDEKTFTATPIKTGLNGGTMVEVTRGLKEGDKVVTGFTLGGQTAEATTEAEQNNNPFMPGPPGSKKKK